MLINEQTKIHALLKHHPDALEAIVTLSPDFKKLRNPVLRTLMTRRTSIAMASKIGGCKPEDFFRALEPLGFATEHSPESPDKAAARKDEPMPEYLQNLSSAHLVHFDVRTMLGEANDPLNPIQQKVKSLKPEEVLVIINNFEPVPLIKLLEKQGFQTYVNFVDSDTIETYFYKAAADDTFQKEPVHVEEDVDASGDWEDLLIRYRDNLLEIDVRHLEMPQPMMTILENLEMLPEGKALYVNHKKIPVFLLTELKEQGFDYRIKEIHEGRVDLLIFK